MNPNRNEFLQIDKQVFSKNLEGEISKYHIIDEHLLFKSIHIALESSPPRPRKQKYIFYHIHNPSAYAYKLSNANNAPQSIVMVREPIQSCESG